MPRRLGPIASCSDQLKAELALNHGRTVGAIRIGKGYWMWSVGGMFVSYAIIDEPVALAGTGISVPFLIRRHIVISDIFVA